MMEEASDDTNGESTFEFISGKIDETSKGMFQWYLHTISDMLTLRCVAQKKRVKMKMHGYWLYNIL